MSYVEVEFPNGISNQFRGAFTNAASFWNNVISSGAPPLTFSGFFNAQGLCGVNRLFSPGETIRGVRIFSFVQNIDGPGSILGSAGPCGFSGQFARLGIMRFDSSDIGTLAGSGSFEAVVRHEMAHVLGIGTLWSSFGLIRRPCPTSGTCNTNPRYTGANGNAGFRSLGGSGEIPIANTGGAGTRNGHWREATFVNELMTGFLNSGFNPVSVMTVRSLRDLGFGTRLSAAEPYSIPREGEKAEGASVELIGDVLDFEAVDVEAYMLEHSQTEAIATRLGEQNVLIGIIVVAGAALMALVAVIAVRRNKKRTLPTTIEA